jgi:hypothetical protein
MNGGPPVAERRRCDEGDHEGSPGGLSISDAIAKAYVLTMIDAAVLSDLANTENVNLFVRAIALILRVPPPIALTIGEQADIELMIRAKAIAVAVAQRDHRLDNGQVGGDYAFFHDPLVPAYSGG